MKIVRNYLLIVSSIFSLATFAGESVSEKNIFETLVSEGVFVQARYTNPSELPGTGEFKLNSLQCLRDL